MKKSIIKNSHIYQRGGIRISGKDILIEDGIIKKIDCNLASDGAEIIDAEGMDIYPGFVLPATAVGLTDMMNMYQPDYNECADPVQPQVHVKYALDMREVHLQKYAECGITSFHACPGTTALIAGQSGMYHTYGNSMEAMTIKDTVTLKINFTSTVREAFGAKGVYPMTRMGMAALLRKVFTEAKEDVIKKVLAGEIPVLATVNTAAEAGVMLGLCAEFGFRLILHNAYDLKGLEDEIIRQKDSVSILLGSLYAMGGKEQFQTDYTVYFKLMEAGVKVGLSNSGDAGSWGKECLLWSGTGLVSKGMKPDDVIDMLTFANASVLGLEDKIGSLEEGKSADLVIWSANPMSTYQAEVLLCMEEGRILLKQTKPEYIRPEEQIPESDLGAVKRNREYLIKNGRVFGTEESTVRKQDILIRDGKIMEIGENLETKQGTVIDADGYEILPGLVDAHTHQGGFGIWDPQSADLNEMTDPVTPQARAIDGVDIRDYNFRSMCRCGVTSVCITPGSGNVICGQAFAAKTYGSNIRDMVIKDPCALKMALGINPKHYHGSKGKMPMTRMGVAAIIEETFTKALEYKKQKESGEEPAYNEKYEAMLPALNKEVPLKIHCEQFDMMTAVKIAEKFGCNLTIEHAWLASDYYEQLKEAGCYVNFGPAGVPEGYGEMTGADLRMAAGLEKRGVPVSLITDSAILSEDGIYPQMGEVIRAGIPYERMLKMVTKTPAEALGISDRVGSIKEGMDADIAIFRKLPGLDADAECKLVFIDGQPVYEAQS